MTAPVEAAFPTLLPASTKDVRRPDGALRTRWLGTFMLLSVALVALLALWDEERESNAALEDFAQEQATLAAVADAGLATRLAEIERAALERARESAAPTLATEPGPVVRVARVLPDGRALEVPVPIARLVPGASWLEHAGSLVLVLPPGARTFLRTDGRPLRADGVLSAVDAGESWARLGRPDAAALGLPSRTAIAGIAATVAGPLGRWATVVVTSAGRERDREVRARRRLVLGVLLAGGLVLAFGGVALRTQRKELALERELARAELARAHDAQLARENRAATMVTLAAGVAHEVSTPLGVIVGRAEQLAARVADDERGRRATQAILEEADRIRGVVRDFLRLARGDTASLAHVAPREVARAAVALVAHRFAKAGVALGCDAPPGLPAIRADHRLLEQALVNLLLNACDACAPGGRVELAVRAVDGDVSFVVEDDGAGISPEDAARVMEPFFSTKPAGQGSGLGLAIAGEIVKIHRGTLALAPRRPRGTRAEVRVPREAGASREPS